MIRDATLPEDSDHIVQGRHLTEVPPGCADFHPGFSEYCTLLRKSRHDPTGAQGVTIPMYVFVFMAHVCLLNHHLYMAQIMVILLRYSQSIEHSQSILRAFSEHIQGMLNLNQTDGEP